MSTSHTFNRISFVVNPAASKNSGKAVFERHAPLIRQTLGDRFFKVYYTERPGDGISKARRAVDEGADLVVSCGGDGTLHEVLNGVMDTETRRATCAIALFPIGTGNDFAKSIHLVNRAEKYAVDHERVIHVIANGVSAAVDVGHMLATDDQDRTVQRERFFMNEASFGISSSIMNAVNNGRILINKDLTFGFQAIWQQFTYTNRVVETVLDGSTRRRGMQQLCAVFNGAFFGSGMHGGIGASLRDGRFKVTTLHDLGVVSAFAVLSRLYKGTHGEHPMVSMEDAAVVEASPANPEDQVFIEADGELFGCLPATMTNVPSALQFVVPQEWADKI